MIVPTSEKNRHARGERIRAAWDRLEALGWSKKALARHVAEVYRGGFPRYYRSITRWLGPKRAGVSSRHEGLVAMVEELAQARAQLDPGRLERIARYARQAEAGAGLFEPEHLEVDPFAPFGAGRVLEAG